jgi:Mrp family chromosome partitioning ATPase/uncharacterized protein involved in exopolysaccharide biosynthesis
VALEDLTYRDYASILLRRWKLVASGAAVGTALGLAGAKLQTPVPVYEAAAVVRYDPTRGYELPGRQPETGDPLAAQLVFVRSAQVLGNLARRLGQLPPDTPREAYDAHAATLAALLSRIDVITDPRQRTGVLLVRARASTPAEAARVANELVAAYQEENVYELKKDILKRREFIERQILQNDKLLNEAQLAYERYRREHPEAALDPTTQGAVTDIARLEADAQALGEKIRETRRQLDLVRSGRPPSDIGLQAIVGTTSTARLQQLSANFTRLSLERDRLLTEFTEEPPAALQKESEIDSLRGELERELQLILDAFRKREEEDLARAEALRANQQALPQDAVELAHLARSVKVYENIQLQLRSQLEDALVKEAGVTGQVSVVSPASPPTDPVNRPNYVRYGGLGSAGGLFAAFVLAVLIESSRISLRALREIEQALDLPILAVAPRLDSRGISRWLPGAERPKPDSPEWARAIALASLLAPRSPLGEAFRTLRANLQPRIDQGQRVFAVTSANRSEGTTTTAMNLALAFAQAGNRVLLVDADFRHPSIARILGVPAEPGLTDLLVAGRTLEETLRGVADFVTGEISLDQVLLGPAIDHLNVMPCGDVSGSTGELLASEAFAGTLQRLRDAYDLVIFDGPPLAESADSLALARLAPTLLVFDPQRTERVDLEAAVSRLRNAGGSLVGLVANGFEIEAARSEPVAAETQAAL